MRRRGERERAVLVVVVVVPVGGEGRAEEARGVSAHEGEVASASKLGGHHEIALRRGQPAKRRSPHEQSVCVCVCVVVEMDAGWLCA
jgi:hypothetical protein